jgi:UDP-glucose 4-epimerase
MKRILITGEGSYIGTSFDKWIDQWPEKYKVETIDVKSDKWKNVDFGKFDSIFHVAGIVHVDAKAEMEELYYKVNRDLTIEVAKKAKADGAKHFVFMSSIIVYGDSSIIGKKRVITKETVPTPANFYGNSKLTAEQGIIPLESEKFKVAILRPPMIYGKGSRGNYPKLAKLAQKLPIFPDIENERSMLHVENLCEFVRLLIDNEDSGIFFPQNKEFVKTSEMVYLIGEVYGKNIKRTKISNPAIRVLAKKIGLINKVFGNLVYEKSMSEYRENYWVRDFKQSIEMTERRG